MGFFLFVFLFFKGQALKLSIIKAKRVLVDEAEGSVTHSHYSADTMQQRASKIDLPWQMTCMDLHDLQQHTTIIYYK